MEKLILSEYRCSCNKLLFKGVLADCTIEIKCRRCGGIKRIIFSNGENVENRLCSFEIDKKQT